MPVKAATFAECLRMGVEVFQHLGLLLKSYKFCIHVGDEGGFASSLSSNEKAIEFIALTAFACFTALPSVACLRPSKCLKKSATGPDNTSALDDAASTFYDP
uniref:phosphopyruvate hydratase n=1 Tax=Zygnema circumcarinatum TaxID=35869 RepID=A0A6N0GXL4_ZYGCR|nr:phosphopyruvate hydratase [Zygnema circumcarinatum]QKQ14703.1 phosphopyruvate hydratase [Zygnema circumcarinatum]WEL36347.1 phosphopyruvate hydratase [Zygnema circumcarinatum]